MSQKLLLAEFDVFCSLLDVNWVGVILRSKRTYHLYLVLVLVWNHRHHLLLVLRFQRIRNFRLSLREPFWRFVRLVQIPFFNILMIVFVLNVNRNPLRVLKFQRRIKLHRFSFNLSIVDNVITNFFNALICGKHVSNQILFKLIVIFLDVSFKSVESFTKPDIKNRLRP